MLCWTRYIIYIGANERRNQPAENRITGCHLRQGGSSWTLFLHKKLVLSPACFNFAPPGPTLLQKPIRKLVKKLERSDVIPTNHNCRAEAAQALSYDGSRSKSWQDTIHKLLEKATGITVKLCPNMGYQLCPMQPLHGCPRGDCSHQLQGTGND